MNLCISPQKLQGTVHAISSKSYTHRLLICAALGSKRTTVHCNSISEDISATMRCLQALGADITCLQDELSVAPVKPPKKAELYCGESGATLRFLLPVAAALGCNCTFHLEGRLPYRPLLPLCHQLEAHGITIRKPEQNLLTISGKLQAGTYTLPGNISSQFISGLLLAFPLMEEECTLILESHLESSPYVDMTIDALEQSGIHITREINGFSCKPAEYHSPLSIHVEGDWSAAAFWLAANQVENAVTVIGLKDNSLQGDRLITEYLAILGSGRSLDISQCPDLLPILAVAATRASGSTHFIGAARLRMKESDRLESVKGMLLALGGCVTATEDTITVIGSSLHGGMVDSFGDHRIAMAAAIAATIASAPVTVLGAECVKKSYPAFWEDYARLGGIWKEV